MRDAWRLALGTLTVLPVRPPTRVDRRTAGRAMTLAPVVGLLLGLLTLAVVWLLGGGGLHGGAGGDLSAVLVAEELAQPVPRLSPLLAAALVVGLLALATRGLHLDGLADTVDGLGSGASRERALEVMRRGDVGPFGVVTLVLVLVVQVACVAQLLGTPYGGGVVLGAVVLSRLALPALCSTGVPAARPDGLGTAVAGSVTRPLLAVAAALGVAGVAAAWLLGRVVHSDAPAPDSVFPDPVTHALAAVLVAALVVAVLARRCVRRLGGVTGDVLGAGVEVALTAALVVACL